MWTYVLRPLMKKKKNKPVEFIQPKKTSSKIIQPKTTKSFVGSTLPYIIFIFSVINVALIIAIVLIIVLIRFNGVSYISGQKADILKFSYFLSRPDLQSSAKALMVYDATAKVPLLSKNQNLRFSPASTAKIMTALIALEHYKLDTVLNAKSFSENPDISKMGLFLGEKMSVLNLLYGMLLPSGSDAAEVLARNYPGGTSAFVARMNEKAHELALTNTYFADSSGYSDNNYTTASDLARLGAYALKNKTFREIVKTKKITVYNADRTISHALTNLNELLEIPNVTGIKTGFTNEAEGVLTTSFVHNGKTYIIVVLGSKDRFADTRLLIEGIINDLKSESVVP